jgi:exopolysaccharide biosynthesis polyprenyl glycosylphosphotransferase
MSNTAARRAPEAPLRDGSPPGELAFDTNMDAGNRGFRESGAARRRLGLARQVSYVVIDIILVCLGAIVVWGAHFGFAQYIGGQIAPVRELIRDAHLQAYPAFLLLYVALIVMACMSQHLYRTSRELSAPKESLTVAKAVGLATSLLVLFIFISGNNEISRLVVVSSGVLNIGTLSGWRFGKRRYILRRAKRGEGVSRALIVGAGRFGQTFASWLESNQQLGYVVCGFLDSHPNGNPRVLGSLQDLKKIALGQFVDQLFVTLPADRELVKKICIEARQLRLDLNVVPDIYDGLGWRAPTKTIGGFPVIELYGQPIPGLGLAVKRTIDIVLASLGLVLSAPILALAAFWIRFDSPGPVIYAASRVGRKGMKFRCYKLRTMVDGANAQKETLRQCNERDGPFFKMGNDPRITRSGRWLRKFSLDELPQFLNVLLGDMSFVGPRPHPIDDYERYSLDHLRRLDVRPGITGLWQVTARRDPSFEKSMALDLEYIENWSLWLDIEIILKTVPEILRASGA